jgi:hypothetical protein
MSKENPVYKLKFFFDYNSGGCLWCDNNTAREKFGVGILDADIFDLNGNIIQNAKIELPKNIKEEISKLDKLYSTSLNWNDPTGKSLWSENQWNEFDKRAKKIHIKIAKLLGDKYELEYRQIQNWL